MNLPWISQPRTTRVGTQADSIALMHVASASSASSLAHEPSRKTRYTGGKPVASWLAITMASYAVSVLPRDVWASRRHATITSKFWHGPAIDSVREWFERVCAKMHAVVEDVARAIVAETQTIDSDASPAGVKALLSMPMVRLLHVLGVRDGKSLPSCATHTWDATLAEVGDDARDKTFRAVLHPVDPSTHETCVLSIPAACVEVGRAVLICLFFRDVMRKHAHAHMHEALATRGETWPYVCATSSSDDHAHILQAVASILVTWTAADGSAGIELENAIADATEVVQSALDGFRRQHAALVRPIRQAAARTRADAVK